MVIKYYPKSRVEENQYTNGEDYLIEGKPYVGYYFKLSNGQVYSGKSPLIGPNYLLESNKNKSKAILIQGTQEFYKPVSYYPTPTEEDYIRGYFYRFFAKKRNINGFVIEINQETYESLKNANSIYDYVTYETINQYWRITGPVEDYNYNGFIVKGARSVNKRLVESKNETFKGLFEYIAEDYLKFVK